MSKKYPKHSDMPVVTLARLKEIMYYDADSGRLRWKEARKGVSEGKAAGCVDKRTGYRMLKVDYRLYREHRLIWFFHNGQWPVDQIDHINGVRGDNRIENLREATPKLNAQNYRGPHQHGKSGYLGVSWHKKDRRWRASIQVNGNRFSLGQHKTPEAAYAAYLDAKRVLHPYSTL